MAEFRGFNEWMSHKITHLPEDFDFICLGPQELLVVPVSLDIEGKSLSFCVVLLSYPTLTRTDSIYHSIRVLSTERTYLMPSEVKAGGHALSVRLTPKSINHRQRANDLGLSEPFTKLKEYELEINVN
ncbi:hypothetical protein DL98DRAFT_586890 [Cadophora sp. DSE1049]|nr:hypothetical protein DL98DRAFT_586890 [Cadophora sp. DSE1049]